MKLFNYWRSSASWRVRIGLNLKGVAYEYVPVHLTRDGGEQNDVAYRELNPMAQVPALVLDDGAVLFQSIAILEWLEETWPEPPLLPSDPIERARARAIAEIVNSGIQPMQNLAVTHAVKSMGGDVDAWLRRFVGHGLEAIESAAATTRGRFLVGDHPSFADICLVPQLASARRFGVSVDGLDGLLAVEAACNDLAAFRDAHPDRQPDKS